MTVLTIIVFSALIAYLMREITPANHAENVAIEASLKMNENTTRYLDDNEFFKKQNKDVYLSEFSMDGTMISGYAGLNSLFQDKSIPEVINTTISSDGYYHKIIPINKNDEVDGVWVYSYQLKATFSSEYYRYIMLAIIFLIFLSPIIYFIAFSKYYINKLFQRIKAPLEELMTAAHKISEKDLDFNLIYDSNNEIGQLARSFRQMQGELKKSLYENWKKDSEWAVMMSSLSHDLKTPITLIGLGSESLTNDPSLSEDQKMNLDIITRNVAKANRLLANMNIAGSIRNPIAIKDETILSDLINEIESDFKSLINDKSINYSFESKTDMNIKVPYLKIGRVLQNIFSNAVQYTPDGGEIIFIVSQSNNQLLFALENSGKGIKEENWKDIFKKHYREDPSRSNSKGNSGLGLYISKEIIESLGGTLEIANPVKLVGARFEIVLPLEK